MQKNELEKLILKILEKGVTTRFFLQTVAACKRKKREKSKGKGT